MVTLVEGGRRLRVVPAGSVRGLKEQMGLDAVEGVLVLFRGRALADHEDVRGGDLIVLHKMDPVVPDAPQDAVGPGSNDRPADFDMRVARLVDMGYTAEQAALALESCCYRVDFAADKLISGQVLVENPLTTNQILAEMQGGVQPPGAGLPEFGALAPMYFALTPAEQVEVLGLVAAHAGRHPVDVLQFYYAADRDRALAHELLLANP